MKELPGDVFVVGQILPEQMRALIEQGMMSVINNRPDMEVPLQPLSDDMEALAQEMGVDYHHIPMAGGLEAGLIAATRTAYANLPRPILAFCASGTRSTALWCFAHVDIMGVDGVLDAAAQAGYNLLQLREPLLEFLESLDSQET